MHWPDPHGILERLGRDVQRLSRRSQERWLSRAFAYWRRRGFPYPELTTRAVEVEWSALQRIEPSAVFQNRYATASTVGLRLANAFHPQIWEIRCHGRSALDCFNDDRILRHALAKSLHFYPHRRCWNAQCVRSVLRFHHRSRVSNFRPAVARALYMRYSCDGQRILDFAAGFGGRMLAALTLRRTYCGIDPAWQQVAGLQRMSTALAPRSFAQALVLRGCAEELLPAFLSRSFDLILTSPPYFNTERYDLAPDQSCRRYTHYAEWRERFLRVVIEHGCRVLRPGGRFLLNVKDRPGMPIASDARRMFPRAFRAETELRLLLPALPHCRAANGRVYHWEPILVLRRPASVPDE
jgi:SAM-dependent methyltransferase